MSDFVDIPLLRSIVFRQAINEFRPADENVLLNSIEREGQMADKVYWDVDMQPSGLMSKPNTPNAEAHIYAQGERSVGSASWMYLRDKMLFRPSTTMRVRQMGTTLSATESMEARILKDSRTLVNRQDNFAELCCWATLSGKLTAQYRDNVWSVDFMLPPSHEFLPAVSWASATPQQIIHDVTAWKERIKLDSGIDPDTVWTTEHTFRLIFQAWTRLENGNAQAYLTEPMKASFWANGTFGDNFLGLNWRKINSKYLQAGAYVNYVPDGALYIGSYSDDTIKLIEGPSYDFEAGENYVGRFSKTWDQADPSGRAALVEWRFMPVLFHPERVGFVSTVAPDLYAGVSGIH